MKIVAFALIALFIASCASKMIPLKGSYPTPPLHTVSDQPFDTVWSRLIDFVAEKGINVKLIDKASGVMITEDYDLRGLVAYENKKGELSKPYASVVTSIYKTPNGLMGPARTVANWNVRIKPQSNGTFIGVNLTNIKAYSTTSWKGMAQNYVDTAFDVRTLGNFERELFRHLK